MKDDNDYTPKLDADLVSTLTQIFALGYIDRMAGFHVTDDDLIAGVDAREIEGKALDCIAQREDMIQYLAFSYETPPTIAMMVPRQHIPRYLLSPMPTLVCLLGNGAACGAMPFVRSKESARLSPMSPATSPTSPL